MLPRVTDANGFRRPFVYPWRVSGPWTRQFEADHSRPREIRFFQDGRLASTGPEPWLVLGGDPLGRDVFARLLAGGRLSFSVAALAVLFALALGSTLGAIAGFAGGRIDRTITAVADLVIVLPLLYVLVTLRAYMPLVLEPAAVFWTMVAVMGLATWPVPARGVRAIVAAERRKPYAESAYAVGAGPLRILLRHLLPPPPVTSQFKDCSYFPRLFSRRPPCPSSDSDLPTLLPAGESCSTTRPASPR